LPDPHPTICPCCRHSPPHSQHIHGHHQQMGQFRLWRNKQFPHHRCPHHLCPTHPNTYCCTPPKRQSGTIQAHRHVGSALPLSRGVPCPHHPRLGITLPNLCGNAMQCGVGFTLHQNWVYHHTSWPHIMCRSRSKCMRTGLWMIPLQPGSQPINTIAPPMPFTAMAANIAATSMAGDHARFIHQALCSPPTPSI
jgi:hypothetical protein